MKPGARLSLTYAADNDLDKTLDRIEMNEPSDPLRKAYSGVARCAIRLSVGQPAKPKATRPPGDNVQLCEDAVERGACATGDRQHDPVVSLDPGHPVGSCGLCCVCLVQRMLFS